MIPDENGSMKRGRWPMDIFLPAINFQWMDGRWVTYGYTGYRQGPDIGIPAITVDKETNDFYVGVSAQSVFYDISVYGGPEGHQPDFEAFVIAYSGDGAQKWWSRLYSEWIDTNGNGIIDYGPENERFWVEAETHRSPPDQYVDGNRRGLLERAEDGHRQWSRPRKCPHQPLARQRDCRQSGGQRFSRTTLPAPRGTST